jgi:MFS family permease
MDPLLLLLFFPFILAIHRFITSLVVLPLALAVEPYNLNESIVGLCFIVSGIGTLIGGMLGGITSDIAGREYMQHTSGRLMYTFCFMLAVPIGGMGFIYTLHYGVYLAAPLLFQAVLGFGFSGYMSAGGNYLSAMKPANAAAVGSVQMFSVFSFGAVSVSVCISLSEVIGVVNYFWICTGLSLISSIWLSWFILKNNGIIFSSSTHNLILTAN